MRGLRVRILPGLPFLFFRFLFESSLSKFENEEVGVMEKVLDYIRESRAELKKVTWPTKQQMWYSTIVVIVVTFMVSAYLGLVDLLLTGVFSKIVR